MRNRGAAGEVGGLDGELEFVAGVVRQRDGRRGDGAEADDLARDRHGVDRAAFGGLRLRYVGKLGRALGAKWRTPPKNGWYCGTDQTPQAARRRGRMTSPKNDWYRGTDQTARERRVAAPACRDSLTENDRAVVLSSAGAPGSPMWTLVVSAITGSGAPVTTIAPPKVAPVADSNPSWARLGPPRPRRRRSSLAVVPADCLRRDQRPRLGATEIGARSRVPPRGAVQSGCYAPAGSCTARSRWRDGPMVRPQALAKKRGGASTLLCEAW